MLRLTVLMTLLFSAQVNAETLKIVCAADDVHYINRFNMELVIEVPNKQILPDIESFEVTVETTDRGFEGETTKRTYLTSGEIQKVQITPNSKPFYSVILQDIDEKRTVFRLNVDYPGKWTSFFKVADSHFYKSSCKSQN